MNAPRVEHLAEGKVALHCGDCLDVLKTLDPNSVDSIVTDPPYGLEFMGKGWDGADGFRRSLNKHDAGRENVFGRTSRRSPEYRAGRLLQVFLRAVAIECMRVLKPGGHVLAFGGTRTYHRMACAIEDAGFEIRDQIQWLYGSGFPKSLDVSKAIDNAAGAEREVLGKRQFANGSFARDGAVMGQHGVYGAAAGKPLMTVPATDAAREWSGFGTALKPACEPIVLARKPLSEGTVAQNVLTHGTGGLNIDGCRVGFAGDGDAAESKGKNRHADFGSGPRENEVFGADHRPRGANGNYNPPGRWPANIIHDGSAEVVDAFPAEAGSNSGKPEAADGTVHRGDAFFGNGSTVSRSIVDSSRGSAARFFYTAKADDDDRLGSKHPTVKPLDLMQYLVRLVTPPRGLVLDPFAGTGTTGEACIREGMRCVLIEREPEYQDDIRRRMSLAMSGADTRKRATAAARNAGKPVDHGPLFGGTDQAIWGGGQRGRQIYGHFADQDERLARQDSKGD